IVSSDSLLEPDGGVFRLTSNSPTNKFLETLRESDSSNRRLQRPHQQHLTLLNLSFNISTRSD
ncbi:unnamed protein product, partial [Brassica oleracea]